jgi:hypothetical protein
MRGWAGRAAPFFAAALLAAGEVAAERRDAVFAGARLDAERYPGLQGIIENHGDHSHSCGNILLHVTNFGLFGSTPSALHPPWENAPSAIWPAGSKTEYLWGAELWIGALKNATPAVTTAAEFLPGLSELDHIYETRELAPGGARAPAPNADDDGDGRRDEDWLDGRDNDHDGQIDEDFAAISNQMFFCEYSDTNPTIKLSNPEHVPLGFRVQQSSYCWADPLLDDFIAFDFRLINESPEPLTDVYVGFFADCDIGPRSDQDRPLDDWAGFWEGTQVARLGSFSKTVKLSIGYMFDEDRDEGQAEGYIGLLFLGAQDPGAAQSAIGLRNFRMFAGNPSFEQGGDPTNDAQTYEILNGTAPRSLPPADPITGLRPAQLSRNGQDYRLVVSSGPFGQSVGGFRIVDPGDTLGFQAALVIGPGFEGMLENAVQAQLTYDGVWLDCDHDPTTGIQRRETPVCGPELAGQAFPIAGDWPRDRPPSPGNVAWCRGFEECAGAPVSDRNCWVTVRTDGCEWINADCQMEDQTGFPTGVEGNECLIHWLVSSAPPPPHMRLVAREHQVDILWDNMSETTPDLRLNVRDFESYRIWRADNWTRPLGTNVRTGPAGNLWMLMAEFDVPRNRIGADTGLDVIRYNPNIPAQAVEFYREWFAAHPFLQPPDLPGFTPDQIDTAKAMARGVRYYSYTDPPFQKAGCVSNPNDAADCVTVHCPADGQCPPVQTSKGLVLTRCNAQGMCQETLPPPHSGAHYFYSVTATDHKMEIGASGDPEPVGPGLAGEPSSNFVYIDPPTAALASEHFDQAENEIYVVPNPATPQSLKDWQLEPNNDDPTGVKVEFHHLPASQGKVTVFTLAGDRIVELAFDGRTGSGTVAWDLVSRNGQEVTSGVYLYTVEADHFDRFIGRFVVIR